MNDSAFFLFTVAAIVLIGAMAYGSILLIQSPVGHCG